MSTFKNLTQVTMIFFAMMVLFSSCEKDNAVVDPTENMTPVDGNFLALVGNLSDEDSIDSLEHCFEINYPINVNFPEEGELTVNNEEELWDLIEDYIENEDDDNAEFPSIVFPITVTLNDGTVQSVADDQALCDLFHECYGDLGEGSDDENDWEDPCFTFAYPLTLSDGNGNTSTVNSEEEWAALFEDDDYAYFEIVYPVNVVSADGTTQTIADEEALEELFEECDDDDYGDQGDSTDIEDLCFDFVYPLTLNMPDSSTVTVTDEESLLNILNAYWEQNPDAEDGPTFTYPLNVALEDGSTQTVNNDEELEELFEECFGDGFGLVNKNVMAGMARMR